MASTLPAPPLQTPLIDSPKTGLITRVWGQWLLLSLVGRIQAAAAAIVAIALTGLTASIGTTAIVPVANAGLYRVNYRFRVTTPASVSSSLQFTVTTTDGGITCNQSSAAYTGNATNAPQSDAVIVRCDASTPLSYSTTYASVGTAMVYRLDVTVEAL